MVPINDLKFLHKKFACLPIQAVNAKFFGIKKPANNRWPKDVINYVLNRVMGKNLTATINGISDGFVSLSIFDRTRVALNGCPAGTLIDLNQRLIMDGYGEGYDETKDTEYIDYESWRRQIMEDNESEILDAPSNKTMSSLNGGAVAKYISDLESVKNRQPEKEKEIKEKRKSKKAESGDMAKLLNKLVTTPDDAQRFNLMKIGSDERVYVHWTEAAEFVGVNYTFFKTLLHLLKEKNFKDLNYDEMVKEYVYTERLNDLFLFYEETLDVNLTKLGERTTLKMMVYSQLPKLYSCVFDKATAHYFKEKMTTMTRKRHE